MKAAQGITSRAHPLWLAYILHRLSGIGLALFLPVHFWVLSLAMTDPARLDGMLHATEAGLVKLAEVGLVRRLLQAVDVSWMSQLDRQIPAGGEALGQFRGAAARFDRDSLGHAVSCTEPLDQVGLVLD